MGAANWPCVIAHWQTWLLYQLYFLPYPFRSLRLFFIFRFSQLVSLAAKTGLVAKPRAEAQAGGAVSTSQRDLAEVKRQFLLRNRSKFTEARLLAYLAVCMVCFFIVGLVRQFSNEENLPPNRGCGNSPVFFTALGLVLFAPLFSVLFFAAYQLRNVRDDFSINSELRFVTAVWLCLVLPWVLAQALVLNPEIEFFARLKLLQAVVGAIPPQAVLCLWVALTHFKSVWSPLYRSYYAKPPVEYPNNEVVSSLQALLRDERGLERFKEFLIAEFSCENLLFFLDVEEYRQIEDTAQRQAAAQHLFNTYILEDAILEVNINFKSKRTIHAGIVAPSVYTFDRAQEEIYHLMESDSFARFRKSAAAKKLVDELSAAEQEFLHLEASSVI